MNKNFAESVMSVKSMYDEKGVKMSYFQMVREMKDYRPENPHMTGMGEIKFISNFFGLYDMSNYDIQNLRDMVVMMFGKWMDRTEDSDERWGLSQGMMSITTVMDDRMWQNDIKEAENK